MEWLVPIWSECSHHPFPTPLLRWQVGFHSNSKLSISANSASHSVALNVRTLAASMIHTPMGPAANESPPPQAWSPSL